MIDRRRFKGTSILRIGLQRVKMGLDNFDSYIDEMESTISSKQRDLQLSYEEHLKEPQDEDGPQFDFSDEFDKYDKIFPSLTYNSILVSQFSLLETSLNFIIELYGRFRLTQIQPSHLKGGEIEKYKLYFKLVAEISDDELESKWVLIANIQKVRNSIVHHSSKIHESDSNLENYVRKTNGFQFDEHYREFFVKDGQFLKEFNNHLREFFTLLVEKLISKKIVVKNIQMPHGYEGWGREKSENILKAVSTLVDFKSRLDNKTMSSDKFDQLFHNFLGSIAWDATKILSTFYASEWDPKDRDLIMDKGEEGLKELIKIYGQ